MCPYCEKAKEWLTSAGIAYEEIRIDSRSERRRFYEEASLKYGVAIKSMPQVVLVEDDKETLIGGYDRLIAGEGIKRAMP
jgi:glutaredoxin